MKRTILGLIGLVVALCAAVVMVEKNTVAICALVMAAPFVYAAWVLFCTRCGWVRW